MIFDKIGLPWYSFAIVGFALGAYLHNGLIRHAVNWLVIKVLRGFIWSLQVSDPKRQKPENNRPISLTKSNKTARLTPEQLEDLLRNNPDITIAPIKR